MALRALPGVALVLVACGSSSGVMESATEGDSSGDTGPASTMTAASSTTAAITSADGTSSGDDGTGSSSGDASTSDPSTSDASTTDASASTGSSTDDAGTSTSTTDASTSDASTTDASTGTGSSSSTDASASSDSSPNFDVGGGGSSSDTGTMPSPPPIAVAAGTRHTCVVLEGGGVKCWGSGTNGALGYGNELDIGGSDTPAEHGYVDVGGIAIDVAAGFGISCALLEGGAVTCWGAMTALGYGNFEHVGDDEPPADFGPIDLGAPALDITAGSSHICALLATNEVKCWGSNGRGQLGQGNEEAIGDGELPSSIGPIDLGGPVQKVRAGFDFTCAWLQSGDIRCWGYGAEGRLGLGTIEDLGDDELPISEPPVDLGGGTVADFSVGSGHVCVVFDDGSLTCWGAAYWGQLGYASTEHVGDDEPVLDPGPVDLGGIATAVWAGAHNTCAALDDMTIKCWGLGDYGTNGYGNADWIGDTETPAAVGAVSLGFVPLLLTEGEPEHFCALAVDGVLCWGANMWGQLGLGNGGSVGNDELPSDVGFVPL